ncbi:SAM-dependent methyltransferase [Dethiothermospora halolimnae]|uniref:SAM-dependent methyltransferase n=1 Tax=Dethiothermospora halolimnae TaxID=3114390 RepID=UPI003CCBB0FC
MDLLELVELLELDNIDTITYASPINLVATGKILGFNNNTKAIDFGCGRGGALSLWGKYFGIKGIGIELDSNFCNVANNKLMKYNLNDNIDIVNMDASAYEFDKGTFDVASCINASFIFGGFKGAIQKLKTAIKPNGAIIIGEPYYTTHDIPSELRESEGDFHTENEILDIIHEEGFELMFIKRANVDDYDRYRSSFRGDLQKVSAKYMWQHHFGSALYVIKNVNKDS